MPIGISSSSAKQIEQTVTDDGIAQEGKGNIKLDSGSLALTGKGATYNEAGTINLGKGASVKQNDFSGVKGNVTITNTAEGAQAIAKDFIAGTLAIQQQSNSALQKALDDKMKSGNPVTAQGAPTGVESPEDEDATFEIFGFTISRKVALLIGLVAVALTVWRFFFKK